MVTKIMAWQTGSGNITLTYQGQGDGPISIQTDANNGSKIYNNILQTIKINKELWLN